MYVHCTPSQCCRCGSGLELDSTRSVYKDLDSEYPGYQGKMAHKKEKNYKISSFEELDGLDVASGNKLAERIPDPLR